MEKKNRKLTGKGTMKNKVHKSGVKMSMIEMSKEGSSDVLGSYTGVPLIDDEVPVQDQDDL